MVKKLSALLCILLLIPVLAFASSPAVVDDAGLFTNSEISEMEQIIEQIRTDYQVDAVVLTTRDVPTDRSGNDSVSIDYADLYFENNGYGIGSDASGLLYMIDMHNRVPIISTSGVMIDYITDSRLETLFDDSDPYLARGKYGTAAISVLKNTRKMLGEGRQKGQFRYDAVTGERLSGLYNPLTLVEILIGIGAGIATALIFAGSVNGIYNLKGKTYKYKAEKEAQRRLTTDESIFQRETVTRIRKADPPKGGGFSGGGSGGGFGSSVHHSSSGGSHGGGAGRHF